MIIIAGLITNPLLPRAIVLGILGGAGLALTATFSRRGPMIFPVYAAVLAALAFLAARYNDTPFLSRFIAVLAGYCVASVALYGVSGILASRDRRRSVAAGRLPASALDFRVPVIGHLWRLGAMIGAGVVLSAAVAFIAV